MRAFKNDKEILEKTAIIDRFLRYIRIDTTSVEESDKCPSSPGQLELAKMLAQELRDIGLEDAKVDENGYVLATLSGNRPGTIGFIAHIDTAPQFTGKNVKPVIHENYDGKAIKLKNGIVIDPAESRELSRCIGDTIITADGSTLLGADDKAGIAAIMAALEILKKDESLPHPTLRICFNPEEEVGRGADKFPLETFGAPVAFTLDGGFVGEVNTETFSADKATVTFRGVSVHPGMAKGKMVNALRYLGSFLDSLPTEKAPETTEKREGFIHPTDISGDAAEAKVNMILRSFDDKELAGHGDEVKRLANKIAEREPRLGVEVEIKEQYRNMRPGLDKHPGIMERMVQALKAAGVKPFHEPIRGGTDGSRLTAMGMPTPNLFAGGVNFHGPSEWISTRAMALSACTILNLIQVYAESGGETK
ncbi:MAG: peptidase T [Candidatus Eisenbacteria sp.]|nr:peptidase T [Candidatus Eisenbacteria bacterium]